MHSREATKSTISGHHRRLFRLFRLFRTAIASTIAASALTAAPRLAEAQLIGAMPVVDFGAIAQLVTQVQRQLQQVTMQRQQLQAQLANMRKLANPSWRSINTTMAQIDQLTRQGQALSYSLATLAADLQRTFPGWVLSKTMPADMRLQNERTLATIRATLLAAQATAQQFAMSTAKLIAMKGQVGSITSAQQAAELNGTIGIHTAEEITLLRQQLAAAGNAEAVFLANEVNRATQAAAASSAFDSLGARRPMARPRPPIQSLVF